MAAGDGAGTGEPTIAGAGGTAGYAGMGGADAGPGVAKGPAEVAAASALGEGGARGGTPPEKLLDVAAAKKQRTQGWGLSTTAGRAPRI